MKTRRNGKKKGGAAQPARPGKTARPTKTARRPPPPLVNATHLEPILDAVNLVAEELRHIAPPEGTVGLVQPLNPLFMKISQGISVDEHGTFSAQGLALSQADVKPVVDLYNLFSPEVQELVPQIIPPLLTPIFKLILPQAGFS